MSKFQEQIKSFNRMYKLPCNEHPKLPEGYQAAAQRISDFMNILQEEIEEGNELIDKLAIVTPLPEILSEIADWLCDIQIYCASEMRKFGLDNDACLSTIMLSNFSKLDEDGNPIYDSRGKVLKGAKYWPPEPLLREQITHQMRIAVQQKLDE